MATFQVGRKFLEMMSGIAPGLDTSHGMLLSLCVCMCMPLCVLKQMQALASWTEMKIKQCSNSKLWGSVTVPGQVWKLKNRRPVRVCWSQLEPSGKVGHKKCSTGHIVLCKTYFCNQNEIKQDLDLSKPLLVKIPH